ncbi:hypothetical protein AA313_de0201048 [Arthrobotrys entomopaga]|nr:hypothetical protein AA313_de0201048 [Arthrobotrys entomopaga]
MCIRTWAQKINLTADEFNEKLETYKNIYIAPFRNAASDFVNLQHTNPFTPGHSADYPVLLSPANSLELRVDTASSAIEDVQWFIGNAINEEHKKLTEDDDIPEELKLYMALYYSIRDMKSSVAHLPEIPVGAKPTAETKTWFSIVYPFALKPDVLWKALGSLTLEMQDCCVYGLADGLKRAVVWMFGAKYDVADGTWSLDPDVLRLRLKLVTEDVETIDNIMDQLIVDWETIKEKRNWFRVNGFDERFDLPKSDELFDKAEEAIEALKGYLLTYQEPLASMRMNMIGMLDTYTTPEED